MLLNCGVGEDSCVPRTARRSNQSILKEISPEYSLEGLMLRLKLQYLGYLMRRTDSFEKTLCWERLQVASLLSEPWVCCCVQLLSPVRLFVIPRTAARRASSSFTISRSLLKLMFIELVMPSNRLILCHPLLLLPSIFPSIRVFSECPSHHVAKVLELQLQHQSFQ